jgi:hypothetical protein
VSEARIDDSVAGLLRQAFALTADPLFRFGHGLTV